MKKSFKIVAIACSAFLFFLTGCASDSVPETTGSAVTDAKKISIEELHSEEQKVLTSYALLDAKKQTYRIPVSKAMELIAAETEK